jgi:hypothetical protein
VRSVAAVFEMRASPVETEAPGAVDTVLAASNFRDPGNGNRARNFQPGPHETVAAVVCRVGNGIITDEIGLDDGVTALSQLGLITRA